MGSNNNDPFNEQWERIARLENEQAFGAIVEHFDEPANQDNGQTIGQQTPLPTGFEQLVSDSISDEEAITLYQAEQQKTAQTTEPQALVSYRAELRDNVVKTEFISKMPYDPSRSIASQLQPGGSSAFMSPAAALPQVGKAEVVPSSGLPLPERHLGPTSRLQKVIGALAARGGAVNRTDDAERPKLNRLTKTLLKNVLPTFLCCDVLLTGVISAGSAELGGDLHHGILLSTDKPFIGNPKSNIADFADRLTGGLL